MLCDDSYKVSGVAPLMDGGDDERTAVAVAASSPTTPYSPPSLFHALFTYFCVCTNDHLSLLALFLEAVFSSYTLLFVIISSRLQNETFPSSLFPCAFG